MDYEKQEIVIQKLKNKTWIDIVSWDNTQENRNQARYELRELRIRDYHDFRLVIRITRIIDSEIE